VCVCVCVSRRALAALRGLTCAIRVARQTCGGGVEGEGGRTGGGGGRDECVGARVSWWPGSAVGPAFPPPCTPAATLPPTLPSHHRVPSLPLLVPGPACVAATTIALAPSTAVASSLALLPPTATALPARLAQQCGLAAHVGAGQQQEGGGVGEAVAGWLGAAQGHVVGHKGAAAAAAKARGVAQRRGGEDGRVAFRGRRRVRRGRLGGAHTAPSWRGSCRHPGLASARPPPVVCPFPSFPAPSPALAGGTNSGRTMTPPSGGCSEWPAGWATRNPRVTTAPPLKL
jgi:hypothetical protein